MVDKSKHRIRNLFDRISNSYDFMNNVVSFGLHKIVKFNCIKKLNIHNRSKIIDLCCGTGDTCWLIKKHYKKVNVIGVDFSEKMLDIARKKCKYVEFYNMDITNLPFEKCYFDTITCTFGLRNVENINKAIENIYKILKPNGEFMHLDFGDKNILSKIFDLYVPVLCKIFKKNPLAYNYLIKSKQEFLTPDEIIKLFEDNNFILKEKKNFIFNTISMQIFTKKCVY